MPEESRANNVRPYDALPISVMSTHTSGCFLILSLRRGYFFGVADTFSMRMMRRSPAVGRVYCSSPTTAPPSSFAAFSACAAVSDGPFMAAKIPPFFTKGRQYSVSTGMAATALAVAISNCSRSSESCAPSSALA